MNVGLPSDAILDHLRIALNDQLADLSRKESAGDWRNKPGVIVRIRTEMQSTGLAESTRFPVLIYEMDSPWSVSKLRTLFANGALSNLGEAMPRELSAAGDFVLTTMNEAKIARNSWLLVPRDRAVVQRRNNQINDVRSRLKSHFKRKTDDPDTDDPRKRTIESEIAALGDDTFTLDLDCGMNDVVPVVSNDIAPLRLVPLTVVCDKSGRICAIVLSVHVLGQAAQLAEQILKKDVATGAPEDSLIKLARKSAERDGTAIIFHLGKLDQKKLVCKISTLLRLHSNEKDMLLDFASFLRHVRPEFVFSWSDAEPGLIELIRRAESLGVESLFCASGVEGKPIALDKVWKSERFRVLSPYFAHFFMCDLEMKTNKRKDYSLTYFAKNLLDTDRPKTVDLDAIAGAFDSDDSALRETIISGALQDLAIVFAVEEASNHIVTVMNTARTHHVNIEVLLSKATERVRNEKITKKSVAKIGSGSIERFVVRKPREKE